MTSYRFAQSSGAQRHQRGISLVSLMVGLLLGLIAILGMMVGYKNLAQRSIAVKSSAKQDAQVEFGLVGTHMDIQKAGYGIESTSNCLSLASSAPSAAANTDFIVLSNAALSTPSAANSVLTGTLQTIGTVGSAPVSGTAMVWRWVISGVSSCGGVIATQGGLVRLGPIACTSATDWATINWPLSPLIAANSLPTGSAVGFTAKKVSACSPFGAGAGSSAVQLQISAGNSTSGLSSSTPVCLQNICQ